ncbi:hypothetical protein [Streptomyces sp. NPDC059446]|uniref:hypothetical protein n=1 Tax=Streptomyces sp. NPDC059446 TaxID=3346833 RepID=UPI003685862D
MPPRGARHLLAGLVLAVLTLLGGAPATAGAALPLHTATVAGHPSGPAAHAGHPSGPAAHAGHPSGPAAHAGRPAGPAAHAGRPAGPAAHAGLPASPVVLRHTYAAHLTAHTIRGGASAFHGVADVSGPSAATRPARAVRADADPVPRPRAGADRPHSSHPTPPLGHGALPHRAQGLPLRGVGPGTTDAVPLVVVRTGAALPGVRGPPGVTAAQPAVHRSRFADLSSRPL